jgi:PKHD-type hydroxylase
LVAALDAQPVFRAAVLPRLYGPVLLARYRPGMHYGTHIDEPLMGRNPPIRSDVAMTVFLNADDAYDGGELVLEGADGERAIKLAAGDAFVYPATTLHRVEPVTRGERHVLVTWVQSHVRDAACREMLFDLERAGRALFEREGKSEAFDLVMKTRANLLRRWAD